MKEGGRLQARVWTRARLAEICGISEEQVVEWALLMGNDYTEGLLAGHLGMAKRSKGKPENVGGWVEIRVRQDMRCVSGQFIARGI